MNNPQIGIFNVVSCGYIIAGLKGGNGKTYWPECLASADKVIGVT